MGGCFAALAQVCCWPSQRFQRLALRGWNVFFWSAPASFALISTNFCSHCLQTRKHLEMDFKRKRHYFCLVSNWKCQQFELIVNLKNLQERFSVETFHSLWRKGWLLTKRPWQTTHHRSQGLLGLGMLAPCQLCFQGKLSARWWERLESSRSTHHYPFSHEIGQMGAPRLWDPPNPNHLLHQCSEAISRN